MGTTTQKHDTLYRDYNDFMQHATAAVSPFKPYQQRSSRWAFVWDMLSPLMGLLNVVLGAALIVLAIPRSFATLFRKESLSPVDKPTNLFVVALNRLAAGLIQILLSPINIILTLTTRPIVSLIYQPMHLRLKAGMPSKRDIANFKGPLVIDETVTELGSSAFQECTGLSAIMLPQSLTQIGDCAFSGCSGLTSITLPNGIIQIGYSTFLYCFDLTSITLPESLTQIGNSAFRGCTSLTAITLPNGITRIGNSAFRGCTGLTSITLPNGITQIDDEAFQDCIKLQKVNLPQNLKVIKCCAFYHCTGLTSISLPQSLKQIGNSAFHGCTGLTTITLPDGITQIDNNAFKGCTGLTSITLPNGITQIHDSILKDCTGLTSITLPSGITRINRLAFKGCTALDTIAIDAEDLTKFNRIVALLPEELRDKVVPMETLAQVKAQKESALKQFVRITQVSPLYRFEKSGDIPTLNNDIRALISDYCQHDTPLVRAFKRRIESISLPKNSGSIKDYKSKLDSVVASAHQHFLAPPKKSDTQNKVPNEVANQETRPTKKP